MLLLIAYVKTMGECHGELLALEWWGGGAVMRVI